MSTGLKANSDGSAAIQVGGTDVITLTSGGAATFVTSPTTVQAGTAAAPSITFSGDTNTGIYSPGADTIAFTEGGVESMRLNSSGNVGIGTSSPAQRLHISGGTSTALQISATGNASTGLRMGFASSSVDTYLSNTENGVLIFGTNNTERARFNSTGAFVLAGGDTSANGIGITFPATQSASSNANTLDDYEEGTWTPTIIGSSSAGTGTYTTQQGTYTKIGNTVRFQANIVWTAHTGTGQVQVGNYPFASTAETTPISLSFYNGTLFTSGQFVQAYKNASDTTSSTAQTNPTTSALTSVFITNAGTMLVSGVYKVA